MKPFYREPEIAAAREVLSAAGLTYWDYSIEVTYNPNYVRDEACIRSRETDDGVCVVKRIALYGAEGDSADVQAAELVAWRFLEKWREVSA